MTIVNEELAYKILDLLVQNGGSLYYTDILNAMMPIPATDTLDTLTDMISNKLIIGKTQAYERISITRNGKATLQAHQSELAKEAEELRKLDEQARKKVAEDKAEKRSDRRYQLFHDILLLIIGSVITLITEHFFAILAFLVSLFN